jgi:glycosyltransferase involved in cell wall biosynthesis
MTIKYSIVIPTKNRAYYLKYAIKSVLSSPRQDIELVVSNNFSSDETSKILSEINDSRMRVVSPDIALPMASHYEFAISKARGDWITILGDDDAVMPYIFESLDRYILNYLKTCRIFSIKVKETLILTVHL